MTETIGIVRGQTRYGMGDLMTVSLASILRERGYATVYFDGVRLERDLAMLERANTSAILAYNGILTDARTLDGASVWDEARIPCVAWFVDHPIYHLARLKGRPRLLVPACVDQSHVRFLRDWGLSRHTRELHHFAVGDVDHHVPVDRDIDVLFPGSLVDPTALRSEWPTFPKLVCSLIEQSTAECLSRSSGDLVQIIVALCEEMGVVPPQELGAAVGVTFVHADRYVRAQRRVDILDALADAGIVVDHVGHGDSAHPALARHRAHGALPASSLPGWLRRARTVVNAGVNFPAGSHERVFTAQRQGAVAITEANGYWCGLLTEGIDGLLYGWDQLEAVPDRLRDLLRDSDRLKDIGKRGPLVAEDSITRAGDEIVAAVQASFRLLESAS
jgi:hypothetical protein